MFAPTIYVSFYIVQRKQMKKIILFALVIFAVISLCSCGGEKYTEEEIKTILDELLPKSFEMNEIYFGKGLPISEDKDVLNEFYSGFDTDIEMINYHPVSADCPYQNETELRAATLEVFTEDYAEFLFQRAFAGISAEVQNENGLTEVHNAIYAMYIEENGVLTVRLDLEEEAMKLGRQYKTEPLNIISQKNNVVVVSIPTFIDGVYSMEVELRLVLTPDGWRLDSPTY